MQEAGDPEADRGDDDEREQVVSRLLEQSGYRVNTLNAGRSGNTSHDSLNALINHVEADAPGAFWGNLTFVQGHVATSPDTTDPTQFGLVEGSLGDLAAGERLVGYAVLPRHTNLREPLDVYWNDRRLTAVLSP